MKTVADEHVYVYGVTRAGAVPPNGVGVLESRVTTIDCGPIAAIASVMPGDTVRAKRKDLLRHSDVLQQAFRDGVVLPLRFGTLFPGRRAVEDEFLTPHQDRLVSLLDRFERVGELRLRVSYNEQSTILAELVQDDPVIARLSEQAREANTKGALVQFGEVVADAYAARRQSDADAIIARLAEQAAELHVDEPEEELEVVRASFLVERNALEAFDAVLESVALVQRHLMTFSCTGPLPPHSFVDLGGR